MEYFEPKTAEDAVSILAEFKGRAEVIAGGTDVMVDMKFRKRPDALVNINRIPGLSYIKEEGNNLLIGALTTIRDIELNRLVRERTPVLWDAAHQFASLQIRNTATIGGNVGRASPAGETLAPLLMLGAKARVVLPEGEKTVPFSELFVGPGRTLLAGKGLVKEVEVPLPPENSSGIYLKHAVRGAMDIVMVGVGVMITAGPQNSVIEDARIGLAAVAPTPIRAANAERNLRGKRFSAEMAAAAAREAAEEAKPITDHRGSAEYRRWIVEALAKRGLMAAWGKMSNGKGAS